MTTDMNLAGSNASSYSVALDSRAFLKIALRPVISSILIMCGLLRKATCDEQLERDRNEPPPRANDALYLTLDESSFMTSARFTVGGEHLSL
jgi:hypothetical protein